MGNLTTKINFIRLLQLIGSFFLLCLISACSSSQLSLSETEKKKSDKIVLDEKGLPSLEQLMKAGPLPEMVLGSESAPVTMIEYVSLTCPHCRAFHQKTFPYLKKNYISKGKVRYIVREFPIGRSAGQRSDRHTLWLAQTLFPDGGSLFKQSGEMGVSRSET